MPMPFRVHRFVRSRPHLSLAIGLGVVIAPFLPASWELMTRLLVAWDIAVWSYLITMAPLMMRADHRKVKAIAARQDESAALVLASLSVASTMSLAALISQLPTLQDMAANQRALQYGFTILTLLGAWFLVGTLFCFHYAHLYYQAPARQRPLQFPGNGQRESDAHLRAEEKMSGDEQDPDYWDFLYFSFTIAVALQTSDVAVCTRAMRKLVLAQSVLSFFFNLVILGLSINIAAGLIHG
jgi:uncharacterized membrane protein